MELHMRSHHFTHRRPDWRAAIMAGVVFLALELVLATLIPGGSPWASPRMIASIILGRGVLHAPATFEAGIMVAALVVHFVLAIVFALILSLIMVRLVQLRLKRGHGVAGGGGVRLRDVFAQFLRHDPIFPVVRGGPQLGQPCVASRVRRGGGGCVPETGAEGRPLGPRRLHRCLLTPGAE
jgi:uncharacterized membrane protein YagU involved in acid resistance